MQPNARFCALTPRFFRTKQWFARVSSFGVSKALGAPSVAECHIPASLELSTDSSVDRHIFACWAVGFCYPDRVKTASLNRFSSLRQGRRQGRRCGVDLGAHMAECDANYARLLALAPGLGSASRGRSHSMDNRGTESRGTDSRGTDSRSTDSRSTDSDEVFFVELGDSALQVTITVVERSRYTTLVRLAQRARGLSERLAPPSMLVRLYHDARSAEVVEVRNEDRFREVYEYPNPKMRARDEKVQVNRFLGEYLAICLRYGMAVAITAPSGTFRVG